MPDPDYEAALAVGWSPARADRWVQYLAMKRAKGETPISLEVAVAQVEEARARWAS